MRSGILLATTDAGAESLRLGFEAWKVAARFGLGLRESRGGVGFRFRVDAETLEAVRVWSDAVRFRQRMLDDLGRRLREREDRTFMEDGRR